VTTILNISAYLFTPLNDTAALRESIRSQALSRSLKGTVLLAEEGINLFLAGQAGDVRAFVAWLRSDARLAALAPKESWSRELPFRKLLVKVKREIIRMNRPAIRPQVARAPSVEAHTLARWLDSGHDDDGRPVVMLDTRNAFEIEHGRFRGAIDWRLHRFSDFPHRLIDHRGTLEGKTVVSYCTGGIRCEKAALFMAEAGVQRALQLEGGILAYFEKTGGRHFDGSCFVFDAREAVDATLAEAPASPG
jgi:UPF0176 protein